jgi:predicted AAA+ superfamily ATPase
MIKQEIKVTVSGCANVGKSTITDIILRALEYNGINVTLDPSVYELDHGSEANFHRTVNKNRDKRIAAVGKKTTVLLDEVQLSREYWK